MKRDIRIQRIVTPDGLTKHEWRFEGVGCRLVYHSHFTYNRSNRRERWADKDPPAMSWDEWCAKNHIEQGNWDCDYIETPEYQEYKKYLDSVNPVCQKTKQGKPRCHGICATIDRMPPCPPDVAKDALREFRKAVKVVYRVK